MSSPHNPALRRCSGGRPSIAGEKVSRSIVCDCALVPKETKLKRWGDGRDRLRSSLVS